jgi:uncharacterized protein (TIGR00299 family) protein
MSTIYFNCASGISGDMVVGSLLDHGIETKYLEGELSKLGLCGYSIDSHKVNKKGVLATKFLVCVDPGQPRRNLADIRRMIENSSLETGVKRQADEIFLHLARSEASAHDTDIDAVHFHEVGAVDSIIDILSAAILLDALCISEAHCGTVSLGCGRVRTEHGILDIPAPAVRDLLKGAPTRRTDIYAELTTPTGAAILRACVKKYTDKTPETGKKGYGAGTLDLNMPNVLETIIIP